MICYPTIQSNMDDGSSSMSKIVDLPRLKQGLLVGDSCAGISSSEISTKDKGVSLAAAVLAAAAGVSLASVLLAAGFS